MFLEFLDHYKLREQPFGDTPDPHFVYFGKTHCEALASLWYGLQAGRGFLTLVAPPGMGKTTLLLHLLGRLRGSARTVFLFQTNCDSMQLLRHLLHDLGVTPSTDPVTMHQQLNDELVHESRAGKRFVLVIDEAQNLTDSVLETVRLLSDFETSQHKLMQIILAGQPQLINTLNNPGMQQLKQRISTLSWLEQFNTGDVSAYVRHRLQVAGHADGPLFTPPALELIARQSDGIPRNINHLCFSALTVGFALGEKKIGREIVEEVVTDQKLSWLRTTNDAPRKQAAVLQVITNPLPLNASPARPRRRYASIGAAIFLIGLGLTVTSAFRAHHAVLSLTSPPSTRSQAAFPVSTATKQPVNAIRAVARTQRSEPSSFFKDGIVVVETEQTLMQICALYLGQYTPELIQEIHALNPLLVDPNHIVVGQRLRLPVGKIRPSQAYPKESSSERRATSGTKHE
jgi:general secretion pathway protein A